MSFLKPIPLAASTWSLPQASEHARNVDLIFWSLMGISSLIVLSLLFIILYGLFRKQSTEEGIGHLIVKSHWKVETIWMVVPLGIFLLLFAWGARHYFTIYESTEERYTVFIVGRQWMWQSYYPDGYSEQNALHLPVDEKVRLVLSSEDVIHSLYIPAFRLKQDAVPGKQVQISVKPVLEGRYHLHCAEYCGTDHSRMGGHVEVLSQEKFAAWQQEHEGLPDLAARGEALFAEKGCRGCHARESSIHAPLLDNLFMSRVALKSGGTRIANMGYLRDSILLPGKHIVAGYENIMPAFQDQLSEGELVALLAYVQSLKEIENP